MILSVFSVNRVCKKELNLMLKVSETSSQGAVGLSLRGTDFFLPILYDLNNNLFATQSKVKEAGQ